MRQKLTIAFMILAALIGTWQMSTTASAQQSLTLAMVLTGLQTQGRDAQTNTLAKRNIYIANKVKTYGVTFRLTPEIEKELRNAGATTVLIETVRRYGPAAPTPTPTQAARPYATFKEAWIDYDVKQGNQLGMKIHVNFTGYRMRGLPSYLAVYFKDQNGNYLKDRNNQLVSSTGTVALYQELNPCCEPTVYSDLAVFMPYDEFDLPSGKYTLKADIQVIYKAGGVISALTEKTFTYTKEQPEPTEDDVSATVKRTWVEYGVKENNRVGMRLHVHFELSGMKGVDSAVNVRVTRDDKNTYLSGRSSDYRNEDGQFVAQMTLAPCCETTEYKDLAIFIPYDEIVISRGQYDLALDIDLGYPDGDIIKHLAWYEFTFTQKK